MNTHKLDLITLNRVRLFQSDVNHSHYVSPYPLPPLVVLHCIVFIRMALNLHVESWFVFPWSWRGNIQREFQSCKAGIECMVSCRTLSSCRICPSIQALCSFLLKNWNFVIKQSSWVRERNWKCSLAKCLQWHRIDSLPT